MNDFKTSINPGLVTTESHRLFAMVHLPPNGGGGLVFGDSSDDTLQACLEALL
jgi:hypothetical protein